MHFVLLKLRVPALGDGRFRKPIEFPALATPKLRIIDEALTHRTSVDRAWPLLAAIEAFLKTFQVIDLHERIRALEAAHAKEAVVKELERRLRKLEAHAAVSAEAEM